MISMVRSLLRMAESLGATYKGKQIGNFGKVGNMQFQRKIKSLLDQQAECS